MASVRIPPSPDYGPEVEDGKKVTTAAPNARQGVVGHNVRIVLGVSLAAVVVLYALIYFGFFG